MNHEAEIESETARLRPQVQAPRTAGNEMPWIKPVRCSVDVELALDSSFNLFANLFERWWPREYTWGQGVLQHIIIEPRAGGACYELGPGGFRSDWGRVLTWHPPHRLKFAWHISPRREPQPDPARASTVDITFLDNGRPRRTQVRLLHSGFERHGEGASDYRDAMAAPRGWPWILERFALTACPPDRRATHPTPRAGSSR